MSYLPLSNLGVLTNQNYLSNPDAESSTSGFNVGSVTLSSGVPSGAPTIGAVTAMSLSRDTTNKLVGGASFKISAGIASGTTPAGSAIISDIITISDSDLAKVLSFGFSYKLVTDGAVLNFSGTSTQSMELWVYNVGLAAWSQPAGFRGINTKNAVGQVTSTFQTDSSNASNKNQYRLAIIFKGAISSLTEFVFDQAFLSSKPALYGAPITDWQSFTPTGAWTSNTTYTGEWRRVGSTLSVKYRLSLSGAPTAANLILNLPPGLSVDTSRINVLTAGSLIDAEVSLNDTGTDEYDGAARYQTATSVRIYVRRGITPAGTPLTDFLGVNATTPFTWVSGDSVEVELNNIPILGWSSTVQMSNDTDTRVVAFDAANTSNQTLTASVTNISFPNNISDSHGAFSGTNTYTIPVSGDYVINGIFLALSASDIYIYVDGVISTHLVGISNASQGFNGSALLRNLRAGQLITLRSAANVTLVGNAQYCRLQIFRLSGPSAIAATDSVNGKYDNTAGTSLTSSEATVPFATKKYDSHGAYSGTVFTAPIAGVYEFTSTLSVQSVANSTNQVLYGGFRVTSVPESLSAATQGVMIEWGNGAAHGQVINFTKQYKLNAGDTVEVRAFNSNTIGLATDAGANFFAWKRVGN